MQGVEVNDNQVVVMDQIWLVTKEGEGAANDD